MTIDPSPAAANAPYTLSGILPGTRKHRTWTLPELPPQTPDLLRAQASAELRRFATPAHLRAVPGPALRRTSGAHRAGR